MQVSPYAIELETWDLNPAGDFLDGYRALPMEYSYGLTREIPDDRECIVFSLDITNTYENMQSVPVFCSKTRHVYKLRNKGETPTVDSIWELIVVSVLQYGKIFRARTKSTPLEKEDIGEPEFIKFEKHIAACIQKWEEDRN